MDEQTITVEELDRVDAYCAKAVDGPWFVAGDRAEDCSPHTDSGLALVDTGRSADWTVARLCEWPTAEFIAASRTDLPRLSKTCRELLARCNALEVERDRLRSKLDDINLLACYASEENTERRARVLLQIGEVARAALADEVAAEGGLRRFNAELLESAEKEVDELSTRLRDMMACYEQRIRSACTPEQLKLQPWRVAEYVAAEEALRPPAG